MKFFQRVFFLRTASLTVSLTVLLLFLASCSVLKPEPLVRQKHFIWEVRSDRSVIFLVGSVYSGRESFFPFAPVIEDAFDESELIAVESSSLNEDVDKTIALINRAGAYPRFDSLSGHISEETYLIVGKRLSALGLSIEHMEHFKPWFVAMILAGAEMSRMGLDAEHGMEYYFLEKSRGHKTILELEKAEEQINLLGSLPQDKQEAFLLGTLAELDLIENHRDTLFKAWTWGDADAMDSILTGERANNPHMGGFFSELFSKRTRLMSQKVEGFLNEEGRYFVLVGAAHLVGEEGIVSLLRGKGYTVRQL